jgi:hypothetical protein
VIPDIDIWRAANLMLKRYRVKRSTIALLGLIGARPPATAVPRS